MTNKTTEQDADSFFEEGISLLEREKYREADTHFSQQTTERARFYQELAYTAGMVNGQIPYSGSACTQLSLEREGFEAAWERCAFLREDGLLGEEEAVQLQERIKNLVAEWNEGARIYTNPLHLDEQYNLGNLEERL